MNADAAFTQTTVESTMPDDAMAELSLLLPRDQALRLMDAASRQGISVAQFLRRLVSRALDGTRVQL